MTLDRAARVPYAARPGQDDARLGPSVHSAADPAAANRNEPPTQAPDQPMRFRRRPALSLGVAADPAGARRAQE